MSKNLWWKAVYSLFLVAGACIGASMLALPVAMHHLGFIPAMGVMIVSYVFMTMTGLLYLEATLMVKEEGAHVSTLSRKFLGKTGEFVGWITFLFVCYGSLSAYISGGGKLIQFVGIEFLTTHISLNICYLFFTIIFTFIIYLGQNKLEKINSLLFVILLLCYVAIIQHGEIHPENLLEGGFSFFSLLPSFSLMLATFSFPGLVPTLVPYLERDPKAVKLAVIGGTSLTLIIYGIWMFIVFGSVPISGPNGLKEAAALDLIATESLHYVLSNPWISLFAQFFAFFAISTSFLGIGLSVFDFFADAFKLPKQGSSKYLLLALVCLPPLFIAFFFEKIFILTFEITGGLGDALLNGLLPVLIVWVGRKLYPSAPYQLFGGKTVLLILLLIALVIFLGELFVISGF